MASPPVACIFRPEFIRALCSQVASVDLMCQSFSSSLRNSHKKAPIKCSESFIHQNNVMKGGSKPRFYREELEGGGGGGGTAGVGQ